MKGQRVPRCLNKLRQSIREKIGLQVLWNVEEAYNMALKAELMERKPTYSRYRRNTTDASFLTTKKGKVVQTPAFTNQLKGATGGDNNQATSSTNRDTSKNLNPYAKLTIDKCYRCGKPDQHSNACPERRP